MESISPLSEDDSNTPLKFCKGCNQYKTANPQNFNKQRGSKDGFTWICKICRNAKRQAERDEERDPGVPKGMTKCISCGIAKQPTPRYFDIIEVGSKRMYKECKTCKGTEGKRWCKGCDNWFSATDKYFYKEKTGVLGLYSLCKTCQKRKTTEYRTTNPEYYSEYTKEYYVKNHEYHIQRAAKWRKERYPLFREAWNARANERYARNSEEACRKAKEWRSTSPKYKLWARTRFQNRRAVLANAPGSHTPQDIKEIYERQKGRCYYCGVELNGKFDVDHVFPLSRGGSNDPSNLVIACDFCNSSKNNRLLHEWPRGGRLL
jgi:5-methylcytosine-specific restriction endonuclease McrA